MANEKKFINAKELREKFGITKGQLYFLTYNHLIPFYKPTPNGRLLFNVAEVEDWMQQRKSNAIDCPC